MLLVGLNVSIPLPCFQNCSVLSHIIFSECKSEANNNKNSFLGCPKEKLTNFYKKSFNMRKNMVILCTPVVIFFIQEKNLIIICPLIVWRINYRIETALKLPFMKHFLKYKKNVVSVSCQLCVPEQFQVVVTTASRKVLEEMFCFGLFFFKQIVLLYIKANNTCVGMCSNTKSTQHQNSCQVTAQL